MQYYEIVYATNFFQLSIDYLFKQHSANILKYSMAGQGHTVKNKINTALHHSVQHNRR